MWRNPDIDDGDIYFSKVGKAKFSLETNFILNTVFAEWGVKWLLILPFPVEWTRKNLSLNIATRCGEIPI